MTSHRVSENPQQLQQFVSGVIEEQDHPWLIYLIQCGSENLCHISHATQYEIHAGLTLAAEGTIPHVVQRLWLQH